MGQKHRQGFQAALEAHHLDAVVLAVPGRGIAAREQAVGVDVLDHGHPVTAPHQRAREALDADPVSAEVVRRVEGGRHAEA